MQAKLIEEYSNLMHELMVLPGEIDDAQRHMTELKLEIADLEKALTVREAVLLGQAEGKNAEQRKAALTLLQEKDSTYRRIAEDLAARRADLAQAQDTVDHTQRVYGAVCYQTRLTAALLNYLGSAGAPVRYQEIDFRANGGPRMFTDPKNGDAVSAADAKAIGL